jgi:hypothetical protein
LGSNDDARLVMDSIWMWGIFDITLPRKACMTLAKCTGQA